jgi:hypothetical protein
MKHFTHYPWLFLVALLSLCGSVFGQADLSLTMDQANQSPSQYSLYSVTATVSNDGPEAATGVDVQLPIPAGVVYQGGNEFSADQGTLRTYGSNAGRWRVGSLSSGSSATITINYFLNAPSAATSYAEVSASDQNDPDSTPGNGNGVVTEDDEASSDGSGTPTGQADLQARNLRVLNPSIAAGTDLEYRFNIRNGGTANVPGNFTVKSYISTDNVLSSDDIQDGTITTGNFDAGAAVQNILGASSTNGLAPGNYFVIVFVDADDVVSESNENNNTRVAPFTITGGSTTCQLAATIPTGSCNNNGTATNPADDRIDVLITVDNTNPGTPFTIQRNGQTVATGTAGTVLGFDGGLISAAGGASITYTVIDDTNPSCTTTFTIQVPNACSTTTGEGDIDLSLSLTQNVVAPARWTLYTVTATVSNGGPQSATGVVVDLPIPAGVVYEGGNEFSASRGSFSTFGGNQGQWNVGTVGANTSETISISYFRTGATPSESYAEVLTANQTDSDSTPGNGNGQVNEDDEASTGTTQPSTCNINATVSAVTCDDQGTPNDPSDDTYVVDFLVTNGGLNGGWTGQTSQNGVVITGTYGVMATYNAGLINSGVPIANVLGISDASLVNCATSIQWSIPSTCSSSEDPCNPISTAPTNAVLNYSVAPGGIITVNHNLNGQPATLTIDGPARLGVQLILPTEFSVSSAISNGNRIYLTGLLRDDANPGNQQGFIIETDAQSRDLSSFIPALQRSDLSSLNILGFEGSTTAIVEYFTFGRSYGIAKIQFGNVVADQLQVGDLVTNRVSGAVINEDDGVIYLSYRNGNSNSWPRLRVISLNDLSTNAEIRLADAFFSSNNGSITGVTGFPNVLPSGDVAVAFSAADGNTPQQFAAIIDAMGNTVSSVTLPALTGNANGTYDATGVTSNGDVRLTATGSEVALLANGTVINCGGGSSQGVDLELTASSGTNSPAIYDVNSITVVVTNSGTQAATGVTVDIPKPANVVYTGGNEFTSSQGSLATFGSDQGTWTVGNLAPGATATIVVNYFSLSATGYDQFAEVLTQNETDADSTPGNGSGTSANEDDEAFLNLTSGARSALTLNFYPNPAPAGEQIILKHTSSGDVEVPLLISDLNGRTVFQTSVQFAEGYNAVPISIGNLSAGVYILSLSDTGLQPTRLVVR